MDTLSTNAAEMGTLARLPAEIRLQIWEDYLSTSVWRYEDENQNEDEDEDDDDDEDGCRDKPKRRLGLLQTCRQIYRETSHLLYERELFIFQITPIYRRGSWMPVKTTQIRKWESNIDDEDDRRYRCIPYSRFRGLNVEIQAPDPSDPGQIIALWRSLRLVVDLLSPAESLMRLDIYFRDTDKGQWFKDGNPQQSIKEPFAGPEDDEYPSDFKALLLLFTNLRNVRSVCFHVPEHKSTPKSLIKRCTRAMMAGDLFWSGLLGSDLPSDQHFQDELDTIFMQLDSSLDTLPGDTARWLHLQRFSSWFVRCRTPGVFRESAYIKEVERILRAGRICPYVHRNTASEIQNRYMLLFCFNPLGRGIQRMKNCLHVPKNQRNNWFYTQYEVTEHWSEEEWQNYYTAFKKRKDKGAICADFYETKYKVNFAPGAWYGYYKEGIPPLDHGDFIRSFRDMMMPWGRWKHFRKFERRLLGIEG